MVADMGGFQESCAASVGADRPSDQGEGVVGGWPDWRWRPGFGVRWDYRHIRIAKVSLVVRIPSAAEYWSGKFPQMGSGGAAARGQSGCRVGLTVGVLSSTRQADHHGVQDTVTGRASLAIDYWAAYAPGRLLQAEAAVMTLVPVPPAEPSAGTGSRRGVAGCRGGVLAGAPCGSGAVLGSGERQVAASVPLGLLGWV